MRKAWTILFTTLVVTLFLGRASAFAEEVIKPADLGGRWTGTLTRRSLITVQSKLTLDVSATEPTKGRFTLVTPEQRGTWETPIEVTKDGGVRMDMGIHEPGQCPQGRTGEAG